MSCILDIRLSAMPFREKSAWISVLSMSGIYELYFWSAVHNWPYNFHFGRFLETVVALVVVQIVLTITVAIFSLRDAKAPRDEREKLIELRATRVAYGALATGVLLACIYGALDPVLVFNSDTLLFILVCAEILRSASQIFQYRLSA
jgi:hypothetical protein